MTESTTQCEHGRALGGHCRECENPEPRPTYSPDVMEAAKQVMILCIRYQKNLFDMHDDEGSCLLQDKIAAIIETCTQGEEIRAAASILLDCEPGPTQNEAYERNAARFFQKTGLMAPGKDAPVAMGQPNFFTRCDKWIEFKRDQRRDAIKQLRAALDGERGEGER